MPEEGRPVENLAARFGSASWRSAGGIARPFVRYPSATPSPGMACQTVPLSGEARLSVVIPTADANRGGYFHNLLVQIGRQDFRDFEVIVVAGDPRPGPASKVGTALARGNNLLPRE